MTSPRPKSDALFQHAGRHLVGGVNSPVRAFGGVGGTPVFVKKAKGAVLTDVDGHDYVDFVGSWGPMILGHAPDPVLKAVREAVANGTSFGAPCPAETELAELIKSAVPSIEKIRFTSSGTEAAMTALRIARGATKRERIVKFEGAYHGHSDSLLVAAGSGATTFGVPSSAGVPAVLAQNTWVLPFNDEEALEDLFRTQGINIAAVIVEPVCGNMGVVAPEPGFLQKIRDVATRHGALLIFDEVITGFRLAWGGAQSAYGITPDLTCLGKTIGGGFPVGAVGGAAKHMDLLAPLGPVYQAGTLSGNPVAMAAGLATLKALKNAKIYGELDRRTADFCDSIRTAAKEVEIPVQVNRAGSMFTVFFTDMPVVRYLDASLCDTRLYSRFFHALLDAGVYFPPSQFEAAFVSAAHAPAVMAKATKAIEKAFRAVASA